MPSPLLSSLTRRMTRKRRKKVMEMRALSSVFCRDSSIAESVETVKNGESQAKPWTQSATWLCFTG